MPTGLLSEGTNLIGDLNNLEDDAAPFEQGVFCTAIFEGLAVCLLVTSYLMMNTTYSMALCLGLFLLSHL
jgi:hypothetical protein